MVLREAFLGTRHFNDFERQLGVARNILSDRLKKLVEADVLKREASTADRRVVEYRLTEAGKALAPVLISLAQWGLRTPGLPTISAALRGACQRSRSSAGSRTRPGWTST